MTYAPDAPQSTSKDIAVPQSGSGPLGLPLKLMSVGWELTTNALSQSARIGQQVIDDARQGKPANEIASHAVQSGVRVMGSAVETAQERNVPGAGMAEVVTERVVEVVRPVTNLAPGMITDFAGLSEQDLRTSLRQQGQELLRRSTMIDDPDEHPAFRRILEGMSPDEARIIRFLAYAGPQAVVDAIEYNGLTRSGKEVAHNVSLIGQEAGCIRPQLAGVYLDNLERLGVVYVRDYQVKEEAAYQVLYAQPEIDDLTEPEGFFAKNKLINKGVELSRFGLQLYEMCFAEEPDVLAPAPDGKHVATPTPETTEAASSSR